MLLPYMQTEPVRTSTPHFLPEHKQTIETQILLLYYISQTLSASLNKEVM